MKISRAWAMPNHNTLSIKPIAGFVAPYIAASKKAVDPFARDSKVASITNDLNPETAAQYHLLAAEFLQLPAVYGADLVIYDPPYSLRQVKECYNGCGVAFTQKDSQNAVRWTTERDIIE